MLIIISLIINATTYWCLAFTTQTNTIRALYSLSKTFLSNITSLQICPILIISIVNTFSNRKQNRWCRRIHMPTRVGGSGPLWHGSGGWSPSLPGSTQSTIKGRFGVSVWARFFCFFFFLNIFTLVFWKTGMQCTDLCSKNKVE